jgi:SAM-dependent methyltransferase
MPRGGSFVAADAEFARGADLARLYDLDLDGERDDVELYLALVGRRPHSILELACGTGRIAIPLARAGHAVVGVDNDRHMLDRARRAWAATATKGGVFELIEADLTEVRLGRRFDLIILGLNALLMLPGRAAQSAALRAAAEHLAPDGRLVIDVWLPTPADLDGYDGSIDLAWQRDDPETATTVAKIWSAEYDSTTATALITTFFDSWLPDGGALHRVARVDELHLIGVSELLTLVEQAPMAVTTSAGDYAMEPLGPDSQRVVLVCTLL